MEKWGYGKRKGEKGDWDGGGETPPHEEGGEKEIEKAKRKMGKK